MKAILDSSIVLRYLLNGDDSLLFGRQMDWLGGSDLLFVECYRVLERVRVQRELTSDRLNEAIDWLNLFFSGLEFIPINKAIIRRAARPFPVILKSLDAIHFASLEYVCDDEDPGTWAMLTLDKNLARAARSSGFACPLDTR